MSDIDSTAATQATSSSSMPSSYPSPENSQNATAPNGHRTPSLERSQKRRRLNSSIFFPENRYEAGSAHDEHSPTPSNHSLTSHSVPNLASYVDLSNISDTLELQPRSFFDRDREFMSHIISSRGILPRTMTIIQSWTHVPGLHRFLEYAPVPSADNSRFVGWRQKADTWPLDKGRYIQRALNSPDW